MISAEQGILPMNTNVLAKAVELNGRREAYVMATVVRTRGSTSAKPGSKAIIDAQGYLVVGWVGGGCAEAMVGTTACECLIRGSAQLINIDLNDEVFGAGMPCGGDMDIFIEPILPRPVWWVIGRGRIAENLCLLADMLEFDVMLLAHGTTPKNLPAAVTVVQDDFEFSQLRPAARDFVVIASQHKGDHNALLRALASPAPYIALIASKNRAELMRRYLREENVGETAMRRVVAPAGIDIGAQSPAEIALAIATDTVTRFRKPENLLTDVTR